MSFFKDDLKEIKAILLDVDGVLSSDTSPLDKNGDPMRTANVKDGFAIRQALLSGIVIGVIDRWRPEQSQEKTLETWHYSLL